DLMLRTPMHPFPPKLLPSMITITVNRHFLNGLAAILAAGAVHAGDGFSFQDHPGEYLDVLKGGRIVARYMDAHDASTKERRAETYKPYLHVFDAAGNAPITKGPGGTY